MAPKPVAPATRVLLVEDGKGAFKIEIPHDAKVTFGPSFVAKGERRGMYDGNRQEYALRVYVGNKETGLIGVWTGVHQFREIGIPVHRAIIREAGKTVWKSDEEGYSVSTEVKKTRKLLPDVAKLNLETEDDPGF